MLPDLKPTYCPVPLWSLVCFLYICGHGCASLHTSTETALSGYCPDLGLRPSGPKGKRRVVRDDAPSFLGPLQGWLRYTHKLQLQYSPLLCFWQPYPDNLISTRTGNSKRQEGEFCICCSCLLENKENIVRLFFFQAFRSICSFRDVSGCTKCRWGTSDPFCKCQELPSPQSLSEDRRSPMNSCLSRSKMLLLEYKLIETSI